MQQAPDNNHPRDEDALLRECDVAARWNMSTRTLQRWRTEQFGPPFIRLFGSIRYRLADIIAFEDRHRDKGMGE